MNTFQSTFSSPRNQRIMFGIALLVLIGGIVAVVIKFAGSSGQESSAPASGSKPTLPQKQPPLKTASGADVHEYKQLTPSVRDTIKRFVLGAVAEHNYADSWKVLAPNIKKGYTERTWVTASSHPVIPFPVYQYDRSQFEIALATTKQILVSLKLRPQPKSGQKEMKFYVGLVPSHRNKGQWLVDYWGPLYAPLLPYGGNG